MKIQKLLLAGLLGLLTCATNMSAAVALKNTGFDIVTKTLPDVASNIMPIVSKAIELQKMRNTLLKLTPRINAITNCMTFNSKNFPKWVDGKFSQADLDQMTRTETAYAKLGKKNPVIAQQQQRTEIAKTCMSLMPVTTYKKDAQGRILETKTWEKITCRNSRLCALNLLDEVDSVLSQVHDNVLSSDGLMGRLLAIMNSIVTGIDPINSKADELFKNLDDAVLTLKDMKEGLAAAPAKKS